MNPIFQYFVSAFEEFRKVTWPTKEQSALLTAIVISASAIMAILIGGMDLGLSEVYQWSLAKFVE